jgi:hypothetical protein
MIFFTSVTGDQNTIREQQCQKKACCLCLWPYIIHVLSVCHHRKGQGRCWRFCWLPFLRNTACHEPCLPSAKAYAGNKVPINGKKLEHIRKETKYIISEYESFYNDLLQWPVTNTKYYDNKRTETWCQSRTMTDK